ncbi:MAG TPA: ectoine hydroxylase [Gammaproteobacteria bacterium]|nr:ectoine hydroxylase [Gammaproteobacteria bacterium]
MKTDDYPSRTGEPARLIPRQDPVVYAPQGAPPPISQADIDQFEQRGFMVLHKLLPEREVAALEQASAQLRKHLQHEHSQETITEPGSHEVRSIFRIHETSPVFKQLARDKRLAGLARYLLNDDVYIHQSRLNYKPGFCGKEFYWHSDFETWHVEDGMPRMRAVSMSITLTDNIAENGPLMLIPGSHRYFAVCEGITPENHHLASLKKQEYGTPTETCLKTLVEQGGLASTVCEKGSVIVFDCNTIHGSNSNMTPFPRSNVFFVYNALSNQVVTPFCAQPPRPEHLCARQNIEPIPMEISQH